MRLGPFMSYYPFKGRLLKGAAELPHGFHTLRVLFRYMEGVLLLNFVGKNVLTENPRNCTFPENSKITLGVLRIITKVRFNNFNS